MKLRYLSILMWSMIACHHTPPEDPRSEARINIEAMEADLGEDVRLDTAKAFAIISAYQEYAKAHPEDSISPYYLSKAADIYKEIPHRGLHAVNAYNRIFVKYPEHPLAPRAVFMIGFVFDEKYKDRERAAKSYRFFLEKFPGHPLAKDAQNLLILVSDTSGNEVGQVRQWLNASDSTQLKSQQ